MNNLSVEFFGKEYSIPASILTYIDLVSFADDVSDALTESFKKQVWPSIDVIESDNFMVSAFNSQASRFVRKLLENGIYSRTANDYLRNNKGYELFLTLKQQSIAQLISIRKEKLETYRAGLEGATYRRESSITGLDFSVISNSFISQMVYAYMDAAKQVKQEQEAINAYNNEIAELRKQAAEYDRQESAYVFGVVIPAMNTAFTLFAYELLDKYISDLIEAEKFDKRALDYIDLNRSNDLLRNLDLSNNQSAIIESAFRACPFNTAVYIKAMKYDLLDSNSFLAAVAFKQGDKILGFLRESIGIADYPKFVQPNLHAAALLARYTRQDVGEVLSQHTRSYVVAVINGYRNIIEALNSQERCRALLGSLTENEILAGENSVKQLARALVKQIVSDTTWSSLVEQCGHGDLLGKLVKLLPCQCDIGSKAACDDYLAGALFSSLETVRKSLAQRIVEGRAQNKAEQQKIETAKRKKLTTVSIIFGVIFTSIIATILTLSAIAEHELDKRESFINAKIQEVVAPLETEMEEQVHADVIIDYDFSLEYDWGKEQQYWWSFSVRLPMLEDYQKSSSSNEQLLLTIMDACRSLNEVYDGFYDSLDLDFKYEDVRIVMLYSCGNMGSLKIQDTSSYEVFYYEEYGGERYLHSFDTEYVINSDLQVEENEELADNQSERNLSDIEKIEYASKILGRRCDEFGNISLNKDLGTFINGDNPLFGEYGHFKLGAYFEDSNGLKIDTLDWVSTDKVTDFSKIVTSLQTLYGECSYINATGDVYTWINIEIYEEIVCVYNEDQTVTIRWKYRVSNPENQILGESLKADLKKIREYAGYIEGAEANVLTDYPHFEDDGNAYYECEDQLFGITGHYKFEYFEGRISAVRFTWIPADWQKDEDYVVECLKICFGDFTDYCELLNGKWFCYIWEYTTDDNLEISYYIAEDEGEIIVRAR